MEKAYNVYKIYEKTGISVAFRKFTLLLAFGVCFFGLQTQMSAQATYTMHAPGPSMDIDDTVFLGQFDFNKTSDEAILVLREQRQVLSNAGEPQGGIEELDYAIRTQFLDISVTSIVKGASVSDALGSSFLQVSRTFNGGNGQVDIQSIAESYARLLE